MARWSNALELNERRERIDGSETALCAAVRGGADLRIETAFRHNEHVDTSSDSRERVREVSEFPVTYVLDRRWTAGFMTLRQPVDIPVGFGARPSLSLFLYNHNGIQAIARPYLDGKPAAAKYGASPPDDHGSMPKYHQLDNWDAGTNAPSSNFVYDFDVYRFWVNEEWQEVLAHGADGTVTSGSLAALADAFASGCEVKVGIAGLCADLASRADAEVEAMEHEVFVQVGFTYYYPDTKLFLGETHPVVRVNPAIPLRYASGNWDYGWLMPRTDGYVAMLLYDPHTLQCTRKEGHFPIRWFVR